MTKKAFALILSFVLLISLLASCADNNAGESSDAESAAEASSDEVSSAESNEESMTLSEEVSEEKGNYDYSDFVPVIRLVVCSDTHISSTGSTEALRLKKMFTSAYKYAESSEYPTVDAVLVAGDMTNYGKPYEYDAFKNSVNAVIKEETQLITVIGNHEYYGDGSEGYIANMDPLLDKDIVIKGFHIIGLSTSDGSGFSSESFKFLSDALEKAAAESDKPIFTFQHQHLKNTVYVSPEWYASGSDKFVNIFKNYPQVINFSGHSHGPINNPESIWQGDFTCVGTGTLSYFEHESGMTYGTIPPNSSNAAQFYIVEVDAENHVRLLPYNLLTDDFFKTPSNLDDEDEQLIYYIDCPTDKSTFRYADRKSEKPFFGDDAEITLSGVTFSGVNVSFPQAYDDDCIYSYKIVCKSDKDKKEFNYFSEYYYEPLVKSLSFSLNGLKSDREYTVEIYPIDCFDNVGEPITSKFTTLHHESAKYTSENDVNFVGTFTCFELDELKNASGSLVYGGKADGDVFCGAWNSSASNTGSTASLADGKGYNGSKALAVSSSSNENQGLYIFATAENKNTADFTDTSYLRVWVDFTDVAFRKANFGFITDNGALYDTDENDGNANLDFYYLADGSTEWKTYKHGDDGCFGDAQGSNVKGFKGWLAFPSEDFMYRSGTGSSGSNVWCYDHIRGIYLFWDYSNNGNYLNKPFYLDEIQIVEDYTVFEEYKK